MVDRSLPARGGGDVTTPPANGRAVVNVGPLAVSWAGLALGAILIATLGVHLPVLGHYFFVDDFVPLADIASRSVPGYIKDLFLLNDVTPNWRFLTGLFYLVFFKAFGLNATPYLAASVVLHTASAGLLFLFVQRATGRSLAALCAAAFFGLTAAHAHTVAQVTAFNNVLAIFLLLVALVCFIEGTGRERRAVWIAASTLAFAGAITANESVAVVTPVFGLIALWRLGDGWWRDVRAWARPAAAAAPHVAVGGSALLALGMCGCTEAASVWEPGGHLWTNVWVYAGRLLYPVGLEAPGDLGAAHLVAGIIVALWAAALLAWGPPLARISVVFLVIAIIPYLAIEFALAPRYVYMAAVPFGVMAGLTLDEAARFGRRAWPAAPVVLVVAFAAGMGLSAWQAVEQNAELGEKTEPYRELIEGLDARFNDLPDGTWIHVRGGPLQEPLAQFYILPAIGEVLWGDVSVYTKPEGAREFCGTPGRNVIVLDYDGGRYTPIDAVWETEPAASDAEAVIVECDMEDFPQGWTL